MYVINVISGWTPRGQATAMPMALLGPWPDLSMHLAGVVFVITSSLSAESAARRHSNHHHHPHQE
jgi:hypothetical protein